MHFNTPKHVFKNSVSKKHTTEAYFYPVFLINFIEIKLHAIKFTNLRDKIQYFGKCI